MAYKALNQVVTLESLSEGDVIEVKSYIEKLLFFKKYSAFGTENQFRHEGTYITDRRYREYSEIGLHYYKYSTLIEKIPMYGCNKLKVCFDKDYNLYFKKMED